VKSERVVGYTADSSDFTSGTSTTTSKPMGLAGSRRTHPIAVALLVGHFFRGGVSSDIGQRLLSDPEPMRFNLAVQALLEIGFEIHLDPGSLTELLNQPTQIFATGEW
jgi:hypothetical protein